MPCKQLVLNIFFIIQNYFIILHFSNFLLGEAGKGKALKKRKIIIFSHLFSLNCHVFHQIEKPYYVLSPLLSSPLLPILSPLLLGPKIWWH